MCVRPLPDAGGLRSDLEFQTLKQLREKPEQTKGFPVFVLSSRHTVGGAAAGRVTDANVSSCKL